MLAHGNSVRATVIVLALAAPLFTAGALATSDPLMRVTVAHQDPQAAAAHFSAKGFDVLEGSIASGSFDLIVSDAEFGLLDLATLNIVGIERGRPLNKIVVMDDGTQRIPTGYPDLAGVNQRMMTAASDHPAIATLVNLTQAYGQPQTFEGRDLYAVKISDNVTLDEDEPAIQIVSTHHAREIIVPVIALDAIDRLTDGYGTDAQITNAVDNYEIWIAPMWNPDGYNEVVVGDNLWRKNRRVFAGGTGVDQNRNYPQGWNASCGGSTFVPSQTYRGPSPASEAETQTMIEWSQDQRFAKIVDYHSFGEEVLYGYSCSSHPFTSYYESEADALSVASGYFGVIRPAGAEGEHYQWQLAQMGAWAHLVETSTTFQPSFASATAESNRVWPGILHAIERPIPLTGHVTDAFTGAPLDATIVPLGVLYTGGETNASGGPYGRYHYFAPAGVYDIEFSAPGYFPQTINVELFAGVETLLDVQLISTLPDTDGDGAPDTLDNCTLVANPAQLDGDADGYGNLCDADIDNNCVVNFIDLSLMAAGFGGSDPVLDLNGDGVVNFLDFADFPMLFSNPPGPSNVGIGCP